MKLERGQVRVCLWPHPNRSYFWSASDKQQVRVCLWPHPNRSYFWSASDKQEDALFEIDEVVEVGSCGAQSDHIVVLLDSVEEITAKLPEIERKIVDILENRSLRV